MVIYDNDTKYTLRQNYHGEPHEEITDKSKTQHSILGQYIEQHIMP